MIFISTVLTNPNANYNEIYAETFEGFFKKKLNLNSLIVYKQGFPHKIKVLL